MACNKIDDEFTNLLQQIFSHVSNIDDSEQVLFNLWTEKLLSEGDSLASCKIRNKYANFLLYVLENDNLVLPFSRPPPQGPLPELQDLLQQHATNDGSMVAANCTESTHSILIENLRVSAPPDEDAAVVVLDDNEELCKEVEALGLAIDVFEFVMSISQHTKDKGETLRMVLDKELEHFNVYVSETFDIKNKDYGDLMARQQCLMKEQYANWTQRVLHHSKKNNQWLLENIPDFDWNQYRSDPKYLDTLFKGTFKGEPVVETNTQEGDDVSKWRNQNFHKLIWMRDRTKKVQETNDGLRSELEDLQRQYHNKQTLITMNEQMKLEKNSHLRKQLSDLRQQEYQLDQGIGKLFAKLEANEFIGDDK